ncbi:MAG TPA: thioesterase family protein [Acidimicrobiales bacterium]|nr:thioesterase family protein [Acidimicrobiales bacterium]
MDAAAFLGLVATEDPLKFRLPVTNGICTGGRFLFGGAGLAAGVVALEQASGRPLVWATAQYLSFARPPSVLDLDVTLAVVGNQITQGRVVMSDDADEVITLQAALGKRGVDITGQWAERPVVPPPDDCRGREFRNDPSATISSRIEERVAIGRSPRDMDGTPGDGRAALWCRMPELLDMSPAALAVLGDFVPFGVSQATGRMAGGNSLDNTLRVATLVPTEWVLLDVRIHAIENGFAHGLVHLWAEDGTLLATASQSVKVRMWR